MRRLKAPFEDIRALSRQAREQGGTIRFECMLSGASMEPAIRPGDILLVETASADVLTPGDVIVYRDEDGRHVAHRLVRRGDDDASQAMLARSEVPGAWDEVVLPADLIGRVVQVRRVNRARYLLHRLAAALRRLLTRPHRAGNPAC
jgi:signal peptidase I